MRVVAVETGRVRDGGGRQAVEGVGGIEVGDLSMGKGVFECRRGAKDVENGFEREVLRAEGATRGGYEFSGKWVQHVE